MQQTNMSNLSLDKVHSWTKDNFYRTSYQTMRQKLPDVPKDQAIPGYAGHIPYVKSDNIFGRPYSAITRDSFSRPELGFNKFKISSSGFAFNKEIHHDPTKTASTFTYGAQTIQKNAPCWDSGKWVTMNQTNYRNPTSIIPSTYKYQERPIVNNRPHTAYSGFNENNNIGDGHGSVPHKILHPSGNNSDTEHRLQFGKKDFHRNSDTHHLRKLRQKSMNYKHT